MTPTDALVTAQDFQNHVMIAQHVPFEKNMIPHVLDAQLFDIMPVLGNAFFVDLVDNQADANYDLLLNGGTYDVSGSTKLFMGLKKAICLFAYSRWCMIANINSAAHGLVTKKTGESEPVEQKDAIMRSNREREKAMAALNSCVDFIRDKGSDEYPLFFSNNPTTDVTRRGVRFFSASQLDNNN